MRHPSFISHHFHHPSLPKSLPLLHARAHHTSTPASFPFSILSHTRALTPSLWHTALTQSKSTIAIDATSGRGSDTLTLGGLLGHHGIVHAIDIQKDAIEETRQRYQQAQQQSEDRRLANLKLWHMSHDALDRLNLEPASVGVVAYNLGWYPSYQADRSVVTKAETTVRSLEKAKGLVSVKGVISVMVYTGHEEGEVEEKAVLSWVGGLSKAWNVLNLSYSNRERAPRVLIIEHRG